MTGSKKLVVPSMRPLAGGRSHIVSVLDIGSTKTCCLIAKLRPFENDDHIAGRTHSVEVIGYGYQRSQGIRSGIVVDLDAAEGAIRKAVASAERMSGVTIQSVIVATSCGRLSSDIFSAHVELGGRQVEDRDIENVLLASGERSLQPERRIVHSLPVGYTLNGERGVLDPRSMIGDQLGVDMHVVSCDEAPLRNLELAVQRCHLDIEAIVAAPYASGLSSLVDDEAEMGVACIDMGGGTTTIAIFANGQMVHVDALAIGGHHVTLDIARGLSIRLQEAERIKTLYGSSLVCGTDQQDFITVAPVGEDGGSGLQIPKSALVRIIRPRVEETLEMIRDRLLASGFAGQVGKRLVLTGGASQLTGVPEVARRLFGRTVRQGRPLGMSGLPEAARGPVFATAIGMLVYPQVARVEQYHMSRALGRATGTGGYFSRFGEWLRESF